MNLNKQLACGIASWVFLVANPVFAQDNSALNEAPQDASMTKTDVSHNDEIIVTAQRRAQSLSKVPVAVSDFNAAILQERNITSEQDLASLVPGLIVKSGQNQNQLHFTMRGQNPDPFSGPSPAVLTYVNEAPATEGNTSTAFFDFNSIQVLKGTQGTLFGRNATGGAILYETTKPGDVYGGYLNFKGGERNYLQVQGALDIPVSDKVRLRVAGDYKEKDG